MITYNFDQDFFNSQMWQPIALSSVTAYYIRKLVQQNFDRLSTATGIPLAQFDVASAAEPVLTTLQAFLNAPEAIATSTATHATIRQLEQLTLKHQTLNSQGAKHRQDVQDTETELFRLLGLHLQDTSPQASILVVDDTPEVLRFLSNALTQHSYEVCSAINGAFALGRAHDIQPDLILLDIMMPGIDGYETCERLKADPLTQEIPIIFISAINDGFDKVKAFGLGAADYVTKPFQIEEVLARIEHQLRLRNLQKRLEEQNRRLQAEIQARQQTEADYRNFFDYAINGMFRSTPDGRFQQVNSALVQLLGYESPQHLITSVANIAETLYVLPQRRMQLITYLNQYAQVTDFESQVYRYNGSRLWISEDVRTVKDAHGNLLCYEGMAKDITDRKSAEMV
jgi:adenylate cyclase